MNSICFRARPVSSLSRAVKPFFNNKNNNTAATIFRRPPPSTFFSTSAPKAMAQEFKLKGVTSLDLKPGSKQEVEVEGLDTKVLLLNDGSKVQAVGAKCTHYGAPLVNGVLTTNGRLTCPWHGACFNAKTGDVEDAPALDAIPVYKVTQKDDGSVYISAEEATVKAGRRKPNIRCKVQSASVEDRVLVVGGGSGAIGAVEALRTNGFQGPITMISNEGHLPIDRTKLSKALIADASKLEWRDKDFFQSGSVEIVDDEVTGVSFGNKTVSTKQGGSYAYNKLILATGGTAKSLPLQGFKVLSNIFTLRNVHDVKQIVDTIGEKGKKIVVVGSSFIGMEVANATAADNEVHVIGMEGAPLERILGTQVGTTIQKAFEEKGVKFHMNAGVDKAEPCTSDPSKVGAVLLKDGTRIDADLVILGVGVSPSTQFLKENTIVKLEDDGSLKTDENFSVVGLKDVYAIGDIATYPYHGPGGEGKYIRIEHWNVAQNAGRTAAYHIVAPTRKPAPFTPVFWSALTAQLRYCGNTVGGYDDVVIQGSLDEGKWAAFYTKGETVVAVATMGKDPVMSQSAELMALGKMPRKSQLKDGLDPVSLGPPE